MLGSPESSAPQPMAQIVRVAVVVVTLALFLGSTLNAVTGQRDLAVLFALATPLGISAWGFSRAGHHEPALVLLCCVLITLVTLVLILNPLGVHNIAVTAYGGIVLVGALLLSRRSFFALFGLTLFAASTAFLMDIHGLTRSRIGAYSGWPQYLEFLVITGVFATMGRYGAEVLIGSVGAAHRATVGDPVTGLHNRPGFLAAAMGRLAAAKAANAHGALVLVDLDGFRRVNVVVGHRAGDAVLLEAARRLVGAGGAGCLYGRIGDDEFAVLGAPLADEQAAHDLATAIHKAMSFEFSGVSVRSSAGYARFPRDAGGVEALLLAAEGSLTRAKDHEHEAERFAGPADRI